MSGENVQISFRRDHISTWWQLKYGKLNADQVLRLETDPDIAKILVQDPLIICEAIFDKNLIKLKDILNFAQSYVANSAAVERTFSMSENIVDKPKSFRISEQYFPTQLEPLKEYRSARDTFVSPLNSNYRVPETIDLTYTSKYTCQICNDPVVGNECGCRLTS